LNQATGETKEETTRDRPLKEHVEAFEKMLIENALRRHRGSITNQCDGRAVAAAPDPEREDGEIRAVSVRIHLKIS